ncbi:MAG: DUF1559 domain-containing protein [Planctomycetia bacterium]|nr:DUF1559 domain-containing protein [Planctomycetia bacterium]
MTRRIPRTRTAFTIVELLVVIAIIGTLVALLIPAVQMARESGRRSMCTNNMHQLAIAAHQHEEAFGVLPPGLPNCVAPANFGIAAGVNGGAWCQGPNWAIALLPYLEEQALFEKIKVCMIDKYNVCDDCTAGMACPTGFLCPSAEFMDSSMSFTNSSAGANNPGPSNIFKGNYAANFGSDTYLSYKSPSTAGAFDIVDVRGLRGAPINQAQNDPSMAGTWKMGSKLGVKLASITDGLSTTILLSEVLGYPGPADNRGAWSFGGMGGSTFTTKLPPNSLQVDVVPSCQPFAPPPPNYQFNCTVGTDPIARSSPGNPTFAAARSAHSGGGVVVVMVDGSTHYISGDIDATLWQKLGTRRAGDTAELPPQ